MPQCSENLFNFGNSMIFEGTCKLITSFWKPLTTCSCYSDSSAWSKVLFMGYFETEDYISVPSHVKHSTT